MLEHDEISVLNRIFKNQCAAFQNNPMMPYTQRIEHLDRVYHALLKHQDKLVEAIVADYGHRSRNEMRYGELLFILESVKYYKKQLKHWMQPQKRHVNWLFQPAKAKVVYQPLGVVGIIVPWNYPLFLSIGPLLCALAAGNRVMIKMSSHAPRMAEAMKEVLAEFFHEDHVAVITGQGTISRVFPTLPFNLIVFTGSPEVGKEVMECAAKNLTPVILELGGKSPVIAHPSYPIKDLAERLSFGKLWNAGQTCTAPDYLLLPQGKTSAFVEAFAQQIEKNYPTLLNNDDYTGIVNDKQYNRLQSVLDDAKNKGAQVIELNAKQEVFSNTRKIPPTVVTGVTDDMRIMQEEIFGPILPIREIANIEEAINYVNARPRPLAFYYFDYDKTRSEHVIAKTHSGGIGINDTLTHTAVDDLPFGGVGNSGMGKYHGLEGFVAMSNARAVFMRAKIYSLRGFLPPFNKPLHKFTNRILLKRND